MITKERLIYIITLIILILLSIGLFKWGSNNKRGRDISEYNLIAIHDTLSVYKTKNGETEGSISVLIAENGSLKTLNKSLNSELSDIKGKVSELNRIIIELGKRPDTVIVETEVEKYKDGSYGLSWDYDTVYNEFNSKKLKGVSKFKIQDSAIISLGTYITDDKIRFKLVTGLKENNGNIEIFAKSDYPGFDIISLEGAMIDPETNPVFTKYKKKKRFGIGPYIGVGISQEMKPSIQIGVGLSFNPIRF